MENEYLFYASNLPIFIMKKINNIYFTKPEIK